MQIPPIIPESTGVAAPAQRKDGAAISGLVQLVTGTPTLPRADPRLATIIVPPALQLSEAAITAGRDRQLWVESEALAREAKLDRSGFSSRQFTSPPSDKGLAIDLGAWLKQLSRQSSGPIRWPSTQSDLLAPRDLSVGWSQPVKTPSLLGTKIVSPQISTSRGSAAARIPATTDTLNASIVMRSQNDSVSPSKGDEVRLLMGALVQGLAISNLFAARNLAGWITGERLRNNAQASPARASLEDPISTLEIATEDSGVVSGAPRKLVEQWMRGIDGDSSDALEAAQLLLNGKLIWQGQLADGTPMLMQRFDIWREPKQPRDPVERGVGISIETELKSHGRLRIDGRQWGDALEIVVTGSDSSSPPSSWHGWQELVERLNERTGARVISRAADSFGGVGDVG